MTKTVIGMTNEEAEIYIQMIKDKYPDRLFKSFKVEAVDEYANIQYEFETIPFERIRRITGYLVGNLNRFNDGKLAEVKDRVKHGR